MISYCGLKIRLSLAISAAISVAVVTGISVSGPDARYFIGTGQVSCNKRFCRSRRRRKSFFLIMLLSPSQERIYESVFTMSSADRTGLILDIFAQRRSRNTRRYELQVELCSICQPHLKTRLIQWLGLT